MLLGEDLQGEVDARAGDAPGKPYVDGTARSGSAGSRGEPRATWSVFRKTALAGRSFANPDKMSRQWWVGCRGPVRRRGTWLLPDTSRQLMGGSPGSGSTCREFRVKASRW